MILKKPQGVFRKRVFKVSLIVLAAILTSNLRSVYELAKIIDVDVSNLNKIIDFFLRDWGG